MLAKFMVFLLMGKKDLLISERMGSHYPKYRLVLLNFSQAHEKVKEIILWIIIVLSLHINDKWMTIQFLDNVRTMLGQC